MPLDLGRRDAGLICDFYRRIRCQLDAPCINIYASEFGDAPYSCAVSSPEKRNAAVSSGALSVSFHGGFKRPNMNRGKSSNL